MGNFYSDKLKKWIGPTLAILTIIALFGVVFLELGWAERSSRFYTELALVSVLALQSRFYWFESAESKVLSSDEIISAKKIYDDMIERTKINVTELDLCLIEMDRENYENSLKSTIGFSTPQNIGQKKYKKLVAKAHKNANKIKKLKSSDVLTRGENLVLYDSKNYQNKNKFTYQVVSGLLSIAIVIIITMIAFEQIKMSWENLFRYLMYVWSMFVSMVMTIIYATKKTRDNTLEHLSRLQLIVDRFVIWRDANKKEVNVDDDVYRESK